MDTKRLLIAALLSLGIMISWSYFFPPPEPQRPLEPPTAPSEETSRPTTPTPPPETQPVADVGATGEPVEEISETPGDQVPTGLETIQAAAEERVVVTGQEFRAEFTNRGAQLISFQLLEHRNADGGPVDLVRARPGSPYLFGLATLEGTPSAFNEALFVVEREYGDFDQETLRFVYQGTEGRVTKRFGFQPDGLMDL